MSTEGGCIITHLDTIFNEVFASSLLISAGPRQTLQTNNNGWRININRIFAIEEVCVVLTIEREILIVHLYHEY